MRIGIDIGPITRTRTGVGNYCYYLLKHLLALESGDTFAGFSSGTARPDLGELSRHVSHYRVPIPTRALYAMWTWLGVPKVDRLLGEVDVYHAANYFLPPTSKARRVVTIHDLAFLAVPELCSPKIVGPFAKGVRRFVHDADAVLAYSESTKRDMVRFLGAEPAKVTVAPMAVDEGFTPVPRDEAAARVKTEYGIAPPFLLFVSTLEPRKNVPVLLRAFARLAKDIPHKLVLIGSVGWNVQPIFETIRELSLENRVLRPGFVPHGRLPLFYCAADAFVFPTRYEGFGLPLLEALTCGCPVVTANNSSVPEVTGDAALCVDAMDVEGLAAAIRRVLEDEALREGMMARGRAHARRFSWRQCAETTLAVYRSLA